VNATVKNGQNFDVVVVGSGIVGVSVALHCMLAGAKAAVVDAGFEGRASAAGAGIVSPVGLGGSEASDEWTHMVASAITHYQTILGLLTDAGMKDVGFGRVGELVVGTRDADHARLDELAVRLDRFAKDNIPLGRVERLRGSELNRYWPELRDDLEAIYIENIARMDGRRMCAAIGELGRRGGVTFISGRADITLDGQGKCTLSVDDAPLNAGSVVLATGSWSRPFLQKLGVSMDVQPVRGQIAHLRLNDASADRRPVVNTFEGHYFLGFPQGRVVTGATHEPEAGFDSCITAAGVHAVLGRALRIAPGLSSAALIETRVGLRPRSADGYPIVGRPNGVANVVTATGLGAWGLTLGPLIGQIAAEKVLGLPASFEADFLRPNREPIAATAVLSPNIP
jgi:D-amino-acid dehydrogenase